MHPAATVVRLWLLHANANALSASAKMKPPWHVAWPLSMSARTVIVIAANRARRSRCDMPSPCDALSRAYMASAQRCASACASSGDNGGS